MTLFETETMAELCIKQGLAAEGVEIYRRLVRDAPDQVTRARRQRRLGELERALGPSAKSAAAAPEAAPGSQALTVRPRAEGLEVEWNLPDETRWPALQPLLVRRTPAGVETETRTILLEGARGRTSVPVAGVHSVRAAIGRLDGERFVPLARTRG